MQWHNRPMTALSSSSSMTTQSAHSKPRQMNSSIPFRELLLQQQQSKLLAGSDSSVASGIVPTTNSLTNTADITAASAIISTAVEQDRIALATHFQERDRLILQHQQHQLQRKQKQKQLDEHEKPFSSSNRIRDFVIGGGVDRVANIASGKTSGKCCSLVYVMSVIFICVFNSNRALFLSISRTIRRAVRSAFFVFAQNHCNYIVLVCGLWWISAWLGWIKLNRQHLVGWLAGWCVALTTYHIINILYGSLLWQFIADYVTHTAKCH